MTLGDTIGEVVYLRTLEASDLNILQRWTTSTDSGIALDLFYRPAVADAAHFFLDGLRRDRHEVALGIVVQSTGSLAGFIGLHEIDQLNSHAKAGVLLPDLRPRSLEFGVSALGLITSYVFEQMQMNRVWAEVDAGNQRLRAVYERAGFLNEATLRQDLCVAREYRDTAVMGCVRNGPRPLAGAGAKK